MTRLALSLAAMCVAATAPAAAQVKPIEVMVEPASQQMVGAKKRNYFALINESASATIACRFDGPAILNAPGMITLGPYAAFAWTAQPVPDGALNCVSTQEATLMVIQ